MTIITRRPITIGMLWSEKDNTNNNQCDAVGKIKMRIMMIKSKSIWCDNDNTNHNQSDAATKMKQK